MATLEITTTVGCPLMCNFCPQSALKMQYSGRKRLSLDDFRIILEKVPKNVRIDFSGMSEPWANRECTKMLQHALSKGYNVVIYTTLYGIPLEEVDLIVDLLKNHSEQIHELVIHLQDKNNNMRGMKFDETWVLVLNKFIEFYNSRTLKNFQFMTMDKKGEVHPFLNALSSVIPPFHGHDRAGSLNLEQISDQPIHRISQISGQIKCSYTDYYDCNVLLPNGDVLVCCMDYEKKHVFGNLITQNYEDIFNTEAFHHLLLENRKEMSDNSICRNCERAMKGKTG
jgi:organic radical activating enzyme